MKIFDIWWFKKCFFYLFSWIVQLFHFKEQNIALKKRIRNLNIVRIFFIFHCKNWYTRMIKKTSETPFQKSIPLKLEWLFMLDQFLLYCCAKRCDKNAKNQSILLRFKVEQLGSILYCFLKAYKRLTNRRQTVKSIEYKNET